MEKARVGFGRTDLSFGANGKTFRALSMVPWALGFKIGHPKLDFHDFGLVNQQIKTYFLEMGFEHHKRCGSIGGSRETDFRAEALNNVTNNWIFVFASLDFPDFSYFLYVWAALPKKWRFPREPFRGSLD